MITDHDGQRLAGFTRQSVTSVSLGPPYVSFCPGRSSSSWPAIRSVGRLSINVLPDDQRDVCAAPALDGVLATIEAELACEHDAGDHTIAVAHVTGLRVHEERKPLLFYRGGFGGFEDAATDA
ncbi:flavin reductase family protein [Mycobacterium sp. B14F4]|uniref:flavin reductase family protein n=1 Tax=Mycobacterium sp. B14F4 TaxID=3153565 RepID=UPI00325EF832